MKSRITNFLLFMLLLFGKSELQAGTHTIITKIDHAGDQNIALYIEFPEPTAVQLRIRSEQGVLVFEETYPAITIFARKVDLSSLPQGTYAIEVEGPQKINVHQVVLSASELLITSGGPEVIFKPAFRQMGDYFDITLLLLDKQAATLKIYTPDNKLILEQAFKNVQKLEKRFDISRLPAGAYAVIVSTVARTFHHTLYIP